MASAELSTSSFEQAEVPLTVFRPEHLSSTPDVAATTNKHADWIQESVKKLLKDNEGRDIESGNDYWLPHTD